MIQYTKLFLQQTNTNDGYELRPEIVCWDGFKLSVQASSHHYCSPRIDGFGGHYKTVELRCRESDVDLDALKDDDGICSCVPISTVDAVIKRHGGIRTF